MSVPDHAKLVSLLLKKTQAGDLDWKPGLDDGSYQVSFSDNSVRIVQDRSGGSLKYVIQLINDEGMVAHEFHDEELDENPGGRFFQNLSQLYELARRKALGADKILEQILKELDGDVPF